MGTDDALEELLREVQPLQDRLVDLRRRFAMQPELSGEEAQTAATIAAELRAMDIQPTVRVGGHGVVGVLEGAQSGPTIVYRADMDALPIQDSLNRSYQSMTLGVKHACGHDVHMAVALGVADILSRACARLHGRVVFLFQPAEESLDGARAVLAEGLLQQWPLAAVLALHAFPIPVGTIGVVSGLCLAGMDEFRVRFCAPEEMLDDLVTKATLALEALSTANQPKSADDVGAVINQMLSGAPLARTVSLSCWPHPEGHVPPYHLLGLVSIADFSQRAAVHAQIREVLNQIVAGAEATYDLAFTFTNPPLHNDPDLINEVTPVLERVLGTSSILRFGAPYPFSHEDLALYTSEAPTALLWLGTANAQRGIASLLHTPDYDIDEAALTIGARAMTAILWHFLRT